MSIETVRVTATGQAVTVGCKLQGLHYASTTTTGRITLRDGGATGTIKFDVDTAPSAEGHHVSIGGGGIFFATDVHVSVLTNVAGLTLIYDDLS